MHIAVDIPKLLLELDRGGTMVSDDQVRLLSEIVCASLTLCAVFFGQRMSRIPLASFPATRGPSATSVIFSQTVNRNEK